MQAIVYEEFGPPDVLHLAEVEQPTPKDNEIFIKVHASPVGYGDITARNFRNLPLRAFNMPLPLWLPTRLVFGLNKPRKPILGSEFAGEVEAVGRAVTRFQPGDAVFGYSGTSFGAYAEYLCMAEDGTVAHKPANMTMDEAATVPYGTIMAYSLLQNGNIQPGHKVLVNGASGGIGSYALQLAKHYGAEVTGVCSTPRVDFVKTLGANHVIDYTQEDFTQRGETYDLIFDVLGKTSFARGRRALTPNGRYLYASFKMKQLFQMLWTKFFSRQKVICALASEKQENLVHIKELVEAGAITTVIDRRYPMDQAAEAHRYVESGQKRGHVIITLAEKGSA